MTTPTPVRRLQPTHNAPEQPKPWPMHNGESPPPAREPPARSRMVAILHNAAMDFWDVATEEDPAQMWEEARAIASRILAACPTA